MPAWLIVLLLSAAAAALTAPLAIRLSRRFGIVAAPGGRRQHQGQIPKLGGLPIMLALAVGWLTAALLVPVPNPADRLRITGIVLGASVIFIFGLLDDRFDLKPGLQFALQTLAALIAVATTVFIERFTNPLNGQLVILPLWLVIPFTVFWIVGMVNTVNWLDGLDGLATGVALIAAVLFALHMQRLGQSNIALYAVAVAGACLGFLPFNISPARLFLGGAGPMVLGYVLATLSIIAPARYATALLVMAVPITDTAWQIFDRWRRGQNPMRGDRGHLHFRLVDAGHSPHRIVWIYWVLCGVFGVLSLLLDAPWAKLLVLVAVALVLLAVLAYLARSSAVGPQNDGGQPEDDHRHPER